MALSDIELEELTLEYLARVGDQCIKVKFIYNSQQLISTRFKNTLRKLDIVRNCFERCSKITDSAFEYVLNYLKILGI